MLIENSTTLKDKLSNKKNLRFTGNGILWKESKIEYFTDF